MTPKPPADVPSVGDAKPLTMEERDELVNVYTSPLRDYVEHNILRYEATCQSLESDLRASREEVRRYEEQEAAVCPEDIGFVEFTQSLQKQLAASREEVERLKTEVEHVRRGNCDLMNQNAELLAKVGTSGAHSAQVEFRSADLTKALEGCRDALDESVCPVCQTRVGFNGASGEWEPNCQICKPKRAALSAARAALEPKA